MTPHNTFLNLVTKQKNKEQDKNIWENSPYKDLVSLQSNNAGVVGEDFFQSICESSGIKATIDGTKTKKVGGGFGDGIVKNSKDLLVRPEIKLAHQGSTSNNFQHELGETPWNADFLVFIDISPKCIYLTIFKNFNEDFYKSGKKCEPYFPTKSITWRKKSGSFKLDTTVKINEDNIKLGNTVKITQDTNFSEIGTFIKSKIG
jgi:hypothetical protein